MSPISRMARFLLILHSLVNMALGAYSFVNTAEYAAMTGMQASDQALQSIGLGAISVGWYQLVFTLQGNRRLMASTVPLRCGMAAVMAVWDKTPLVLYELCVVWFCLIAVFG